jgi:4-hydroxybenzoyl-CoA reductase subunit alpha
MSHNFSIIGKDIPRQDGKAKIMGAAQFSDDLKLPGMLYGKILRSPVAHARIKSIDTSKAEKLPGVKLVITGEDTPKINFGNWRLVPESMDEYPLAIDRVRFIGDEVAAVAAIDKDTAEEAISLIEVEYEELPAVYSVDDARADCAIKLHDNVENNTSLSRTIHYGDVEKAFAEADLLLEDTFEVHAVSHAYMEPCSCLAKTDLDGRITIWTSTQTPYYVQVLLAQTLGMRENDIRVIRPFVGGGFGGKMELRRWEFCAAFMSKLTGKPVKFTLTILLSSGQCF